MRILFLDIDGVLCLGAPTAGFEASSLSQLKRLANKDITFVLSSTWKFFSPSFNQTNICFERWEYLINTLKSIGIELHSCTPALPDGDRGLEIKLWLDDFFKTKCPNKLTPHDHVIILDDTRFHLYDTPALFVTPKSHTGLTESCVDLILDYINTK